MSNPTAKWRPMSEAPKTTPPQITFVVRFSDGSTKMFHPTLNHTVTDKQPTHWLDTKGCDIARPVGELIAEANDAELKARGTMKIYISTAGGRRGEYAYVTPICKNKTGIGYDYLCVWSNYDDDGWCTVHEEGKVSEDLEDIYLHSTDIDINTLPIAQTFLFREFARLFTPPQYTPQCPKWQGKYPHQ